VVEPGAHEPGIGDLLFPAINFAIFAFVLVRYLAGPIREYFRERTERLRDGLQAGKRAHEQAASLRAQLDQDLRDLPAVRERLKADLLDPAEEARVTLLAQGRQAAERIRTDAALVAEQEAQAAERAVRAEIVEEAIRQATAIVREQVTADDQARFVRDFVESARGTA
jgi:F0F1-type ATP synthase membrane subunit b/b'